MERRSKVAFTLAETLITLGIIGVVAALTLPSVIQKYKEKAVVTKVKHGYSMLSQAFSRIQSEYGTMDTWEFPEGDMYTAEVHIALANYFKPYLKLPEDCVGKDTAYIKKHCLRGRDYSLPFFAPNVYQTFTLINGTVNLVLPEKNLEYGVNVFTFGLTKR